MRDVPAEAQPGDGFGDKAVIELLRIVNLMAARISSGVEMTQPWNIVLDGAADVAFHNLEVINIVEQLDTRRVHALAYIDAPGGVIAHVILVIHFAVEKLHANGDAPILRVRFDAIQKSDAVIGAFRIGHAPAVAGKSDQIGDSRGRAFIDGCMRGLFQTVMIFLAIERVRDCAAGAGRIHGGDQTVFLEGRPIGGADQIEALATQAGGLPAHVFEGHVGRKNTLGHALLEPALAHHRGRRLRGRGDGTSEAGDKLSASHIGLWYTELRAIRWNRLGESAYNRSGLMNNQEISLVLLQTEWKNAPAERDPRYFDTWQRVSIALQKALRASIPELYFGEDAGRYEDRDVGYQLVVYEACRAYYGRPRTEFTYDVADPATLAAAIRTIGRSMRTVLERTEKRLHEAGRPELARRYAPVWHQDILAAVRKKPKRLLGLLANEGLLINAVIDLGTLRNQTAMNRLAKVQNAALRKVFGVDMRELGGRMLDQATRVLSGSSEAIHSVDDLLCRGTLDHRNVLAARSPRIGIG